MVKNVKSTVTLQPRQGKWIPIVCNFVSNKIWYYVLQLFIYSIITISLFRSGGGRQLGLVGKPGETRGQGLGSFSPCS